MRYVGGKVRQARAIRECVQNLRGDRSVWVEPFIGGGSVLAACAPLFSRAIASDLVPDLALLWRAGVDGWAPPGHMTREEWEALRDAEPSALRAWAGYAASYNGKWYAGYGPKAAGRDYLAESQRAFLRKVEALRGLDLTILCGDYSIHSPGPRSVVYCDIPYKSTETYKAAEPFDHGRFWETAGRWTDEGALVLVHEYSAPEGWEPVLVTSRAETMNCKGRSSGKRAETLFRRA